ncbi:MAG: hypothetical protein K0U24_03060 [Gammaproteobacteria bacterium]|nr:hypothetical protein [Gammaproteobacteria bacterium]MCH9763197.1 hypothetical protein [Gammaproteobacteria bacterium]
MDTLDALIKPQWGAEKWILEGWKVLTSDEQAVVTDRMNALFSNGLPFELHHDKALYICAFSLLAQLEVLAIQVPLKFEKEMPTLQLKKRMRMQLLDEVFHGLIFTRIVYELIAPYAVPPTYNNEVEALCNLIREEKCSKAAVILLNLVAEALIEELFEAFYKADIASVVFDVILEDEHRHVSEAELYREVGLPAAELLDKKLIPLEEKIISSIFMNYAYVNMMVTLLGAEGFDACAFSIDEKHKRQLSTLNLTPGESWNTFMQHRDSLSSHYKLHLQNYEPIALSSMRKVLMTQWKDPVDPTMVGEFDLNVTGLNALGKKKDRPYMLPMIMLKTIGLAAASDRLEHRCFSHHKLYKSKTSQIGLVVTLPGCDDHHGTVIFENPHKHSIQSLVRSLVKSRNMMIYCYKRRLILEQQYPALASLMNKEVRNILEDVYSPLHPPFPFISLSLVSEVGYMRAKSPLRVNESLKLSVLTVQKKPIWSEASQRFEPEDMLPISINADHRIFDGGAPFPEEIKKAFTQVLEQTLAKTELKKDDNSGKDSEAEKDLRKGQIEALIVSNPEAAYRALTFFQTVFPNYLNLEGDMANEFLLEPFKKYLQRQNLYA